MTPWREYKKPRKYPQLGKNISVDVAIIGGGMAGVLNAYQQSLAGKKVALIEKETLGSYATMDTTAFITEVIDTPLSEVADIFSPAIAKAVWKSGERAIEEFEKIIEKHDMECEFVRCPNYLYARTRKQFKELEEEARYYKRYGIKAELIPHGEDLSFKNYGYLRVEGQAKFHPTKFLFALAEAARQEGTEIYENTAAKAIEGDGPLTIETSGGKITAKDVIIATYKPFISDKTHLKKAMYRSYVYELHIPKGTFPEALYEDNGNPYYYFRIDPQEKYDRMIMGGEDHKDIFGNALTKKSFEGLREYIDADLLPGIKYKVATKWSGPILEPTDGLPLIGRIKPHYYVATAFSGNGMTYSMISSLLIRDLLSGKPNDWTKAYDPTRTIFHPKRLGSKARDYIEEFIEGALKNIVS